MKRTLQFDFSTVITTETDLELNCSYVSFVNEGDTDIILDGNYTIPAGMERVFEVTSDIQQITGTYNISFLDESSKPKCVVIIGKQTKNLFSRKTEIRNVEHITDENTSTASN